MSCDHRVLVCLHQAFLEYGITDIYTLGVSGWEGNILKYIRTLFLSMQLHKSVLSKI